MGERRGREGEKEREREGGGEGEGERGSNTQYKRGTCTYDIKDIHLLISTIHNTHCTRTLIIIDIKK